jgi:predicted PurR-regulated permease PerM
MSEPKSDESSTGMRRRGADTLWGTLRRFGRLWGFGAFLVGVVVLFRGIVLPFIFGLLLAYLLAPIVARLQPRIGRVLAVIVCYLVIIGAFGAFFGFLLPAVAQDFARLRDAAPGTVQKFEDEWIPRAERWVDTEFGGVFTDDGSKVATKGELLDNEVVLEPLADGTFRIDLEGVRIRVEQQPDGSVVLSGHSPTTDPVRQSTDLGEAIRDLISEQGTKITSRLGPAIGALVAGVAGFLTNLVITFMIAAFVLVDLARVNRFVRGLVPHDYRVDFEELWSAGDRGLSGVVRGQLLICLVNGLLTFIGLLLFQVKYAFLLALLAGAFSLIPIFGTIISSIPIIVIALVSPEDGLSFGPALGMLAWISGIHLLEANVLNPKIIGDSAHIHPVIVIFALLAGESFAGLVGALLAIPATSLVQTAYLHARRRSTVFNRDSEHRA